MKRSTKMLLMKSGNKGMDNNSRSRMDSRYGDIHYHFYDYPETEDKFRGSRDREHYNNGRYAPMRNESEGWMESRFRDRDGREHYENGRFAPMRSEYGAYRRTEDYMPERSYYNDGGERMRPIGFHFDDSREMHHNGYVGDEPYMPQGREMGHAKAYGYGEPMELTEREAKEIVSNMENADGSHGGHWTMEQTEQIRKQYGYKDIDPCEFYIVINAMFADYAKVAKELSVNTIEFYAKMAKAFIYDPDAKPGKVARYFETIPKQ